MRLTLRLLASALVAIALASTLTRAEVLQLDASFLAGSWYQNGADAFSQTVRLPLVDSNLASAGVTSSSSLANSWQTGCIPYPGNSTYFNSVQFMTICRKKFSFDSRLYWRQTRTGARVCNDLATDLLSPPDDGDPVAKLSVTGDIVSYDETTGRLVLQVTAVTSYTRTDQFVVPSMCRSSLSYTGPTVLFGSNMGSMYTSDASCVQIDNQVNTQIALNYDNSNTGGGRSMQFAGVSFDENPLGEYDCAANVLSTSGCPLSLGFSNVVTFVGDGYATGHIPGMCVGESPTYLPPGITFVDVGDAYVPTKGSDFGSCATAQLPANLTIYDALTTGMQPVETWSDAYVDQTIGLATDFASLTSTTCGKQTVPLGVTTTYGVISGANLNGQTTVYGDLATTAAAGKPPEMTVTGAVHVQDAQANLAATDLATMSSFLNALPCTTNHGSVNVGADEKRLYPGVHCYTKSNVVTTSGIILDNAGDASALILIRITGGGALTLQHNVTLAGTTSPCQIFWTAAQINTPGVNNNLVGVGTFIVSSSASFYATTVIGHLFNTGNMWFTDISQSQILLPSCATATRATICATNPNYIVSPLRTSGLAASVAPQDADSYGIYHYDMQLSKTLTQLAACTLGNGVSGSAVSATLDVNNVQTRLFKITVTHLYLGADGVVTSTSMSESFSVSKSPQGGVVSLTDSSSGSRVTLIDSHNLVGAAGNCLSGMQRQIDTFRIVTPKFGSLNQLTGIFRPSQLSRVSDGDCHVFPASTNPDNAIFNSPSTWSRGRSMPEADDWCLAYDPEFSGPASDKRTWNPTWDPLAGGDPCFGNTDPTLYQQCQSCTRCHAGTGGYCVAVGGPLSGAALDACVAACTADLPQVCKVPCVKTDGTTLPAIDVGWPSCALGATSCSQVVRITTDCFTVPVNTPTFFYESCPNSGAADTTPDRYSFKFSTFAYPFDAGTFGQTRTIDRPGIDISGSHPTVVAMSIRLRTDDTATPETGVITMIGEMFAPDATYWEQNVRSRVGVDVSGGPLSGTNATVRFSSASSLVVGVRAADSTTLNTIPTAVRTIEICRVQASTAPTLAAWLRGDITGRSCETAPGAGIPILASHYFWYNGKDLNDCSDGNVADDQSSSCMEFEPKPTSCIDNLPYGDGTVAGACHTADTNTQLAMLTARLPNHLHMCRHESAVQADPGTEYDGNQYPGCDGFQIAADRILDTIGGVATAGQVYVMRVTTYSALNHPQSIRDGGFVQLFGSSPSALKHSGAGRQLLGAAAASSAAATAATAMATVQSSSSDTTTTTSTSLFAFVIRIAMNGTDTAIDVVYIQSTTTVTTGSPTMNSAYTWTVLAVVIFVVLACVVCCFMRARRSGGFAPLPIELVSNKA